MSYGYSPYDKKSLRQGKKRRKQAMIADKTGRILPFGYARRNFLIILFSTLAAIVIIAGIILVFSFTSGKSVSSDITAQYDSEQLLTVVNAQNPLDADYEPRLDVYNGFKVNVLAKDMLSRLVDDAKSYGADIKIKSAYISFEEQNEIYRQTLQKYLSDPSYTSVRAEAAAQKETATAGSSEAQTGLIVDFDISNPKSKAFLERECINYGFILRYPKEKEGTTRTKPSDTHYRYVGKENAIKMRAYNMCLEEYNSYLAAQRK